MSPSLACWWAVTADGELVALVRDVAALRRVERIWRDANCTVASEPCDKRADVQRLQRGEAVLEALEKDGIEVTMAKESEER